MASFKIAPSVKTIASSGGPAIKTATTQSITPPRAAPKEFGGGGGIPEPVRVFMFGPPGTGKTFTIKDLIEAGFKVYVLSTDIGGTGLSAFSGQVEPSLLATNLRGIHLNTWAELRSWLFNPAKFATDGQPSIYDFDPDFLFWDGFSSFQQFILSSEVQGDTESTSTADLNVEGKEWALMKNGTLGSLNRFTGLHNPITGKIWHKIVTCHEDTRNAANSLGTAVKLDGVDTGAPWLQGASRQVISGAFDVTLHTRIDKTEGFVYDLTKPKNLFPKWRGKVISTLPDHIPAAIMPIVEEQFKARGIVRGMVNTANIDPEFAKPVVAETAAENTNEERTN